MFATDEESLAATSALEARTLRKYQPLEKRARNACRVSISAVRTILQVFPPDD
jgi:hypothetical protein